MGANLLMKKSILFFAAFCIFQSLFCAELTARFVTVEAAKKDTVEESIEYLKSNAKTISNPAEKRAVYIFLASLLEQMAFFDEAQKYYAMAAGISASDAQGMPKKTNEQIVLDAVRCALSSGDFATAESYLNSAVRNSKDETVQAYIKLYSQWSELCKANSVAEINEPILMLQAYSKMDSMECVRPSIFLTLWYLTGDKNYASEIEKFYPSSVEAAIVKGDVQLLPTPFWFFVPKTGEAEQGTGTFTLSEYDAKDDSINQNDANSENETKTTKWQLGLFKTESNAKLLLDEVVKKGFDAYITSEKRASGTVYYIVLVREDKTGNVAERLRSAGYDCYAVD